MNSLVRLGAMVTLEPLHSHRKPPRVGAVREGRDGRCKTLLVGQRKRGTFRCWVTTSYALRNLLLAD
jgi:hypothetical protein